MLMPFERRAACESGKCFKITFAEIEVLLMKDMSGHHRKCFIMLKQMFGFDGRQANAIINSYALKTLVLNHHYKAGCNEISNIEQCLEKIFEDMRTILRGAKHTRFVLQMFLPSPFLTTHNVWNQDQDIRNKDLEKRIDKLTKRLQCLKHDSRVYNSKNAHCSSYTFFKTFRITTAAMLCIVAASSFGFIIGYTWKESLNTCSNELCHSIV